jgi:monovalent cation/hydrogen antiporter
MENDLEETVLIIFGLLTAMVLLVAIANRLKIPYPILLVLAGFIISLIPGLPSIELNPSLIFILFLPPILQSSAYYTPMRDFRANLRSISLLAIGLVLATMVGVAIVAHALIPGLPWAAAFVLGAIVAPPDAVAASSIAQRLKLPRRIVTVLEGESMLNDATSLVSYRVAVAAVVTVYSPSGRRARSSCSPV